MGDAGGQAHVMAQELARQGDEAALKARILLGTTNPAKVPIVRAALALLPVEIVTPADRNIRST